MFITRVLKKRTTTGKCDLSTINVFGAETILNEESKRKTMSKFKAMSPIRMQINEPAKKAAVLIPLCIVDGKVSLLYTLRASNLRMHKGQVSFPGGMQDIRDRSLEITALRETQEELGVDQEHIDVWGSGNFIIARGETSVLPVVGCIRGAIDIRDLKTNPAEVEEVFTVPLETLCDPAQVGYTQFKSGFSTPLYFGGRKRIWGLTAVITNAFLRCLLPPSAYTHRIKYVQHVKSKASYAK